MMVKNLHRHVLLTWLQSTVFENQGRYVRMQLIMTAVLGMGKLIIYTMIFLFFFILKLSSKKKKTLLTQWSMNKCIFMQLHLKNCINIEKKLRKIIKFDNIIHR